MSGFSSPPPKLPFALTDPESANTLRAYYGGGGVCAVEWRTGRMVQFTSNGTVFTQPVRDMNGHYMEAPLGMAGETYQDLRASRADRTTYQNTTSRMIVVCVTGLVPDGRGATYGMVSHDGSTWFAVAAIMYDNADVGAMTMHVPPGAYYRTNDRLNISSWREFRT